MKDKPHRDLKFKILREYFALWVFLEKCKVYNLSQKREDVSMDKLL